MHVLIVTSGLPSPNDASALFALDQASAIISPSCDVTIASIDLRSLRRKRYHASGYAHFGNLDSFIASFPLGAVSDLLKIAIGRIMFEGLFRDICNSKGKPDIVHCHFAIYGQIALPTVQRENIPLIVTEHASWVGETLSPSKKRIYSEIYRKASKVLAVSTVLAERIKKVCDVDSTVVPNVVDATLFRKAGSRSFSSTVRVLSASNLLDGKGFDCLLRSFARAHAENKNLALSILGDGPKREELERLTRLLKVEQNVTFFGKYTREEFAKACAHSDYFALASRSETFGVVYAEALMAGLPIITTACGGPEDFVTRDCGLMVPVDDELALSQAFLTMANQLDKYNRASISNYASDKFSPESIACQLWDIYDELLDERY